MPTTIRLTRMGKKKRPFYRLVVIDSRVRRDGAYLANLGHYNPFVDPAEVDLHADEIMAWLAKGATVSDAARALLRREGLLYRYSLVKQGLSGEDVAARMESWRPAAEARLRRHVDDRVAHARQVAEAENRRREEKAKAKQDAAATAGGEGESS